LGDREYFSRCSPVVSKTSDNEHASAALRDSEVLSVKNCVAHPIPEFNQGPEHGSKIPSSVAGQETRYVLKDEVLRLELVSKPNDFPEEARASTSQSGTLSGD
jgi:hypothetical protein